MKKITSAVAALSATTAADIVQISNLPGVFTPIGSIFNSSRVNPNFTNGSRSYDFTGDGVIDLSLSAEFSSFDTQNAYQRYGSFVQQSSFGLTFDSNNKLAFSSFRIMDVIFPSNGGAVATYKEGEVRVEGADFENTIRTAEIKGGQGGFVTYYTNYATVSNTAIFETWDSNVIFEVSYRLALTDAFINGGQETNSILKLLFEYQEGIGYLSGWEGYGPDRLSVSIEELIFDQNDPNADFAVLASTINAPEFSRVPEPTSLALLALGAGGVLAHRKRKV